MSAPGALSGRMRTLRVAVLAAGLLLAGRVICVQVFQHDKYSAIADSQWGREIPIDAVRGELYDRNGRAMALSVTTWKVGVSRSQIAGKTDRSAMIDDLAGVLEINPGIVSKKIGSGDNGHVVLAADRILTLVQQGRLKNHPAVTLEERNARIYPFDGVGASVIGYYRVSANDANATGLEYSLGRYLDGRAGLAQEVVTPKKDEHLGQIDLEEAVHGESLELTIDVRLQEICERRLAAAVDQYGAIGGGVLILEPETGDVLAAAAAPLLNTRRGRHPDIEVWNNRLFTKYYEPGSVFKIFTMASLLRHGAVDTASVFDCSDTDFGRFRIRNDDGHSYGPLTLMQAFTLSSNIFFARAVGNLSSDEMYRDLIDYGFGQITGAPYPGQVRGLLRAPVQWSGRSKPTIAIGQEVGVTPLQMGMALCAVANGGILNAPRMVRRVLDRDGREIESLAVTPLRRVMPEPLTELLRAAMGRVVTEGTGVGTKVDWISIGGKTGTAQKSCEGRGFTPGAYIASFAGILPLEDPRLVILTILDEPTGVYHYAAQSAVPLFREIVTDIKNTTSWLADAPGSRTGTLVLTEPVGTTAVPDVLFLSVPAAAQRLGAAGLTLAGAEKDGIVVQQVPAAGTRCAEGALVTLTVSGRPAEPTEPAAEGADEAPVCPDFVGLSNRQVRSLAARIGVDAQISGSGYVVGQEPAPGVQLEKGTVRLRMGGGNWETLWH